MKKFVIILAICSIPVFAVSCSKEGGQETALPSGNAAAGETGYDLKVTISKMTFNWKVDGTHLKVKLAAPTTGWVGIGFNPSEGMKDAHFVMGYVKDGNTNVTDQHGVSKIAHKENTFLGGTSTVAKATGVEKNNTTELAFSVPLKSNEKLDGQIDTKGDIVVLLAYGKADLLGQQHQFRAKLKMNLTTGKYAVTSIADK